MKFFCILLQLILDIMDLSKHMELYNIRMNLQSANFKKSFRRVRDPKHSQNWRCPDSRPGTCDWPQARRRCPQVLLAECSSVNG